MVAAVWTACTKLLLQKKSGAPKRAYLFGVLLFLRAFLKGVEKKMCANGWFSVVNLW